MIDAFGPEGTGATGAASTSRTFRTPHRPAVAEVPDEATAFSHRNARYLFYPIAMWQRSEDDGRSIATTRAFCEAMRPFTI